MTAKPGVMDDGQTITVRVPISLRKRGGRKLVLAPNGANQASAPVHRRVDSVMVKAVARAFRWREKLENGEYSTIREVAAAEGLNESYVGRILRLTLLAPATVDAILKGHQQGGLQLGRLLQKFPIPWTQQQEWFRNEAPDANIARGDRG